MPPATRETTPTINVTVLNNALVAAYNFNEGSGTVLHDVTGNGHDGVLSGQTWVTGKYSGALSFDENFVTVADANLLDLSTKMTLSAWVRPSTVAVSWPTIIMKEIEDEGLTYSLYSQGAQTPSICLGSCGER